MKKIIFLHQSLEVGGAENLKLALLRNIDSKRFVIKVCTIGKKGPVGKKIEKLGYQVDELGLNPDSKGVHITYKLAKYLKKEKPDLLQCSLFNANFHGRIAAFFSCVPSVITEEHGEPFQYNGLKFLPYKIVDFALSHLTDFIVCCSEGLKDYVIKKEKLPVKKVISIKNCLDVENYKIRIQRDDVRKKHNIGKEIVFITVSALKPGKGHDLLIEALRDLKDAGYFFKCFIAGNGPLKEGLKLKVKNLKLDNDIIFLGNIDNVADYLNASDVFVLPSYFEGLSIALMEAMFMGLTSIVTDVGANRDLIKTGFNGTVILPDDKDGLKNAMAYYLKNRNIMKEFGEKSGSIIREGYSSIDKYTEQYYEIWNKCANVGR